MSPSLVIGVLLAVMCLGYVLYPLVAGSRRRASETPGTALRASASDGAGRVVSDDEIEAAIRSYRASRRGAVACAACGPRPESDAVYCSSCGRRLREGEQTR